MVSCTNLWSRTHIGYVFFFVRSLTHATSHYATLEPQGTTIRAVPKTRVGGSAVPETKAPVLIVGAYIAVSVAGYIGYRTSDKSDRWKFHVHSVNERLPQTKSWKSTMEEYASR